MKNITKPFKLKFERLVRAEILNFNKSFNDKLSFKLNLKNLSYNFQINDKDFKVIWSKLMFGHNNR